MGMLALGYRVDGQNSVGNTPLRWIEYFRMDMVPSQVLQICVRPDILNRSRDFQYVLLRLAVMSSHAAGLDAITKANRVCHAEEPRDMVPSTHNSQILNFLLGRPCVFLNVAVLGLIVVAPGIAARNQQAMLHWSVLVGFWPVLLAQCCFSDPCLRLRTMRSQHHLLGNDPAKMFRVEQPVESQMARGDRVLRQLMLTCTGEASGVMKFELEQIKYNNYQRQVVREAKTRFERLCGLADPRSPLEGASQPLTHCLQVTGSASHCGSPD